MAEVVNFDKAGSASQFKDTLKMDVANSNWSMDALRELFNHRFDFVANSAVEAFDNIVAEKRSDINQV